MIGYRAWVTATCLATLATAPPALGQEEEGTQEGTGHTEIGGLFGVGLPAAQAPASVEGWFYVSAFPIERVMVGGELGLGGSLESRRGLARHGGYAAFFLKGGAAGPYVVAGLSGIIYSPYDPNYTGAGFGAGNLMRMGRGLVLRTEARVLRLSEHGFQDPPCHQVMLLIGIGKRLGT